MRSIFVFLCSFLATFLIIPLLRKAAFRLNILDVPGGRKAHPEATPLFGGVAIFLGLLFGVLTNWKDLGFLFPVFIGATVILVVGLINDVYELSVLVRLFAQVAASLIVIEGGFRISFIPNIFFGATLDKILTVVWIVGVVNAFNCLDGLDGLAAGSAIINCLGFVSILYLKNQYALGLWAIVIIASCLAFLPYNLGKEKIFLGDSGSTFLGFLLACMGFIGNWTKDNVIIVVIPVLILGVPIFDMCFTTIMRVRAGKVKTALEWMQYAGRDHFHHYLVDLGFGQRGSVLLIYFVSFALVLSAIMLSNDKPFEAILSLMQAMVIFGIIAALIIAGKRRHGNSNHVS